MARFSSAEVRRYYDRHTAAFIAAGQGGGIGAIHRAVWGPGVRARTGAFRYVEDQIAARVAELSVTGGAHVVDLGCGVGASLCYLAERLPHMTGTGVTLSPVQARIAADWIERAGLAGRIACLEGDYADLPAGLPRADAAYAIESFAHGGDPRRFLDQCRRLVRPGGLLAICDDFLRPTGDPAAAGAVDRFCRGWHINTLLEPGELRELAREAGFDHVATIDLTPFLELRRPRDRAIALLVAAARRLGLESDRLDYLEGGDALQECLRRGWIGYDLATFQRCA